MILIVSFTSCSRCFKVRLRGFMCCATSCVIAAHGAPQDLHARSLREKVVASEQAPSVRVAPRCEA